MGALPDHEPPPGAAYRRQGEAPPLSVVPGSRRSAEPEPEPTPSPPPPPPAPPEAAPRPAPPVAPPAPAPAPAPAPSGPGPGQEEAAQAAAEPSRWKEVFAPPDLFHTAPPSIAELLERALEERAQPSTFVRWLYMPHLGVACLVTLLAVVLAEAVRNPARFWAYSAVIALLVTVGIHLD